MNKRVFEIYQYLAPAVLAPATFLLWRHACGGNIWLALMAWLLPIVYAYIVPGVGTNILKVWEFDTRFRMGRFRPHHGFVFGSATAALAWAVHGQPARAWPDAVRAGLIFSSVLGFWNVLYDVEALRSGILRVYNQPWADEKGAEAIAFDYAPWFFAGFGAMYGIGLSVAEIFASRAGFGAGEFAFTFPITLSAAMALPVLGYRRRSFKMHGHSGCFPVRRGA